MCRITIISLSWNFRLELAEVFFFWGDFGACRSERSMCMRRKILVFLPMVLGCWPAGTQHCSHGWAFGRWAVWNQFCGPKDNHIYCVLHLGWTRATAQVSRAVGSALHSATALKHSSLQRLTPPLQNPGRLCKFTMHSRGRKKKNKKQKTWHLMNFPGYTVWATLVFFGMDLSCICLI